jgi:hypothetical protein
MGDVMDDIQISRDLLFVSLVTKVPIGILDHITGARHFGAVSSIDVEHESDFFIKLDSGTVVFHRVIN